LHQRPKRISKAKGNKERRAKAARRSFAFYSPRPQLLKGFTKESLLSKTKPSDGDFRAATRGLWTDAFFGASPVVASALGIRSGATPRGRIHSKPSPSALPRKEDISTLLGIGHFYFALTWPVLPISCEGIWRFMEGMQYKVRDLGARSIRSDGENHIEQGRLLHTFVPITCSKR
jgi:hypothetical protein